MLRNIIVIDEEKCDGCGDCVTSCVEGALQLIDGKAKLISELYCDGLGACIGNCPQNAITVIEKECEAYNEEKTLENILPQGKKVVLAHLGHLYKHGQMNYFETALRVLAAKGIAVDISEIVRPKQTVSTPAEKSQPPEMAECCSSETAASELQNWPIQLHLVNPRNDSFTGKDLLITADCVPFALKNFHEVFLRDKPVVIACPKLDSNKDAYFQKLMVMFRETGVRSVTVVVMEVPCCSGLVHLVKKALESSDTEIPFTYKVVGIEGTILN